MNAGLGAVYGHSIPRTLQGWVHSNVMNEFKVILIIHFFMLCTNWNLNPSVAEGRIQFRISWVSEGLMVAHSLLQLHSKSSVKNLDFRCSFYWLDLEKMWNEEVDVCKKCFKACRLCCLRIFIIVWMYRYTFSGKGLSCFQSDDA
jgi:hypothetical protein